MKQLNLLKIQYEIFLLDIGLKYCKIERNTY